MDQKILVTGIGGNVGQGIIRNIKSVFPDIVIVGVNVDAFSAGSHLCDSFYLVPYAVDENYISTIVEIVDKEKIDLIIPSTDYEVSELSKYVSEIPCKIAVSDTIATQLCLDKMHTYYHFEKNNLPFAKSYLPSNYNGEFKEIVVKPREGRGSRGVHINPKQVDEFDDAYMVQELHRGVEVTIAFYVNLAGNLHGFVVQERTLEAGATKNTKVTKKYDNVVKPILLQLIKTTPIKGSANLQAIITKEMEIYPFEVNCRISGTNSMRSQFGFEDVRYTIEEWLLDQKPTQPNIREGIATRIILDVIYTEATDFDEVVDNQSKSYIF